MTFQIQMIRRHTNKSTDKEKRKQRKYNMMHYMQYVNIISPKNNSFENSQKPWSWD